MKLLLFVSWMLFSSFSKDALFTKCWECRSDIDQKCADPFDNSTFPITDCNQLSHDVTVDPTKCRKVVQKENGQWTTIRSCGRRTDPDLEGREPLCTTKSGPNHFHMELCNCNVKDGCNSSSKIKVSLTVFCTSMFILMARF